MNWRNALAGGLPSSKSGADNLIPMELALKIDSKHNANERFSMYVVIPMWPERNPKWSCNSRNSLLEACHLDQFVKHLIESNSKEPDRSSTIDLNAQTSVTTSDQDAAKMLKLPLFANDRVPNRGHLENIVDSKHKVIEHKVLTEVGAKISLLANEGKIGNDKAWNRSLNTIDGSSMQKEKSIKARLEDRQQREVPQTQVEDTACPRSNVELIHEY